jgi:hypothetical protein
MSLVKRQPGERRWEMSDEFPLTDCDGRHVAWDRRYDVDRRKSIASLEELLILFSQSPTEDPERKK